MADHVWKQPVGEMLVCEICGYTRKPHHSGKLPLMDCGVQPGPNTIQKAMNFAKAVFMQAPLIVEAAITGDESKAFRDREEIQRIAGICRSCPFFNGEICTHPACGCPVDDKREQLISKLAWRSQSCPDGPPRWT